MGRQAAASFTSAQDSGKYAPGPFASAPSQHLGESCRTGYPFVLHVVLVTGSLSFSRDMTLNSLHLVLAIASSQKARLARKAQGYVAEHRQGDAHQLGTKQLG